MFPGRPHWEGATSEPSAGPVGTRRTRTIARCGTMAGILRQLRPLRIQHGASGHRFLRNMDDPNDTTLVIEFTSRGGAREVACMVTNRAVGWRGTAAAGRRCCSNPSKWWSTEDGTSLTHSRKARGGAARPTGWQPSETKVRSWPRRRSAPRGSIEALASVDQEHNLTTVLVLHCSSSGAILAAADPSPDLPDLRHCGSPGKAGR